MEPDPAPNNIMVLFILIVISTLIIAFFAAAEMAILSINKNKIKDLVHEDNKKAILLTRIISEPMKYLVAIRTLITFAGVGVITLAATSLSGNFAQYLSNLNVLYNQQIALASVIILLSYTTLVFGELFPKRIARQKPEAIAMYCVVPIMLITKLVTLSLCY